MAPTSTIIGMVKMIALLGGLFGLITHLTGSQFIRESGYADTIRSAFAFLLLWVGKVWADGEKSWIKPTIVKNEEKKCHISPEDRDYSNWHDGIDELLKIPGFVDMLNNAPPELRTLAKNDVSVFKHMAEFISKEEKSNETANKESDENEKEEKSNETTNKELTETAQES